MSKPDFIVENVQLSRYSKLGVGGRASHFADIKTQEELPEAYEFARDNGLDIFTLGRGSNILFSDAGFHGLVLFFRLKRLYFFDDEFWVEAGTPVSEIVSLGESAGFTGFEYFAGLPGTVGGAVYGNAGCYGKQFWDLVEAVKFFDGELFQVIKKEPHQFHYRWSVFKDCVGSTIISVKLKTEPGDTVLISEETERILTLRQANQPKGRNIGCFFRNPLIGNEIISAGKLIDEAGLKGVGVGNAKISDVHANFFVNLGGATAKDFVELIKITKGKVLEKLNILLQEEIIQVGEF